MVSQSGWASLQPYGFNDDVKCVVNPSADPSLEVVKSKAAATPGGFAV
jgi:hypothetical protein